MANWLYSSKEHPIAFIKDDKVFSKWGKFIVLLDDDEICHG